MRKLLNPWFTRIYTCSSRPFSFNLKIMGKAGGESSQISQCILSQILRPHELQLSINNIWRGYGTISWIVLNKK